MFGFGSAQAAKRLHHATRGSGPVAPPAPAAAFSAVAADGWQATVASPTDLSLAPFSVSRQGFSATGAATTHTDTLYLTKRVRQAYPDHASFTADKVALSDYIYSTDSLTGALNSSALSSPKPVAQWIMPSRLLVGNSVHWEMLAAHRNARGGKPVACVRVRGNDGTTQTAWQTVAAMTLSTTVEDANPIHCYQGDLDVSALADGLFWLEAEVYPHVGAAASVRSTADYSDARDFSPRYFTKDTARAATPPLAYVAAGGTSGGVWSTDAATAKATPFDTIGNALAATVGSGAGVTGGKVDGCEIRLGAGSFALPSVALSSYRAQESAALVITRDPDVARASAVATWGTARLQLATNAGGTSTLTAPLAESALIFRDVSVQRTSSGNLGASQSAGAATVPMFVQWWNVAFNAGAQTATYLGTANHDAVFGMTIANTAGGNALLSYTGATQRRLLRGVACANAGGGGWESLAVIGCAIGNIGTNLPLDNSRGCFAWNNRFTACTGGTLTVQAASNAVTLDRVVLVQNLIEHVNTATTNASVQITTNAGSGNTSHAILWHNTIPGAQNAGRSNLLYDDQAGTAGVTQVHTLQSLKGNIHGQFNMKGDVFANDGTNLGNFAALHGVGLEGIYSLYAANSPATEHPGYSGLNSDLGTSSALAQAAESAIWAAYAGTTAPGGVLTAGAGGGDYTLAGGANPVLGRVTSAIVVPADLAGTVRSGAQAAGAYA